jgi:hypothetical protein
MGSNVRRHGKASPIVLGCAAVFALFVLACGIGGYVLVRNAKTIGANFVRNTMTDAINQSQLPAEQKQRMIVQIDRLADGVIAGDIGKAELERIVQNLGESPLLHHLAVWGMRDGYIQPSGLSDEEKVHAERQLQRYAHGVFGKQIHADTLEHAIRHISRQDADGRWQLKEQREVSDDELRNFIASIGQYADAAEISEHAMEVDLADELRKIIDSALADAG